MAQYHVTGVFFLEDPALATTEVFSSAINGIVGIDTAVVVTEPTVEPASLEHLDRFMTEAEFEYHHVVRDTNTTLVD